MNSTEIRNILRSPYNRDNWKDLYRNIFQNKVTFFEYPHSYNINEEIVDSLYQIGYATLDDEYIVALFEVNIKSDVNVLSKKIGLRKVISKYISDDKFNGVLTIFENGSLDYRFTFASKTTKVTEEGITISETESKRYTYILGSNEPCLTPTQRFEGLLKKNGSINLDDIKDAFSVEKLNKEFFNGYKEHYELLCGYFYSSKYKKSNFSNDEKMIRDFVKKFLGRIVFLYFVQKKGWLGVGENGNYGSGDHQFLSNLFKSFSNKGVFYSNILSKIFFDYLSIERKNDLVNLNEGKSFRVPYLNGGLFEKDSVDELELDFNENHLESLFNFFDRFNFTIYEDDPNEHTVAVDPEMLGHIFENLLEDNKDKGAFYTPKEVVHYMCQESLIEYLTTWFQSKGYKITGFQSFGKPEEQNLFSENEGRLGQLIIEPEVRTSKKSINRSLIERLLKKKLDDNDKNLIIQHSEEFHIALDSVKICDPSIGSGAFPMGLLQEIFFTKQTLWNFEYGNLDDFPSSVIKSNIIQNSIYGVDIEKGAVDIARLRFWLSLIVDEEVPKSLPNLDFKIVVGNSLVSLFENEIIEIDWDIKFKNVDSVKKLILDQQNKLYQLEHLQHLYFQSFTNKDTLSKDIKNLKVDILTNQLNLTKFYFIENNPILGGFIPSEIENRKNELNKIYIDKIDSTLNNLDSIKNNDSRKLNYFDWKLNFPEIFNDKITENVGFDILIANPPYLKERDNAHIFNSVNNSRLGKSYHQGKMDFWYYFLHLSIDITSPKSVISFITSRYWINSQGAKKLIQRVKDKLSFVSVVDIGKLKVFDNVAGHHMIHTYSKSNREYFLYKQLSNDIKSIESESNNQNVLISKLSNNDVFTDNEIIFASQELKSDFTAVLGDKYILGQGVVEASDKVSSKQFKKIGRTDVLIGDGVFVLSKSELSKLKLNEEEQKLIGKYIDPLNVKSYSIEVKQEKFIIYSNKDTKNLIANDSRFLNLKSHLDFYSDFITSSNSPYGLHRPRELDLFKSKKILFKGMFVKNECAIDTNGYFVGMSFTSIIEKEKKEGFSLEYLLGILNSKYALNWFYTYGKKRGAGVDIGVDKLRTFPISNTPSKKIESLVKEVIINKDLNKDTTSIENDIENLVYKHYNLKYEEIISIDPGFSLSISDYESLEC